MENIQLLLNRLATFILFPALSIAGNISCGLQYENSKSSYSVQEQANHLKSKLIFPTEIQTLRLSYSKQYKNLSFSFGTKILIQTKNQKGKDYDWKDNKLTVYSYSQDKITEYKNYFLDLNYLLNRNFKIHTSLLYEKNLHHWFNTKQTNFITNTSTTFNKDTLIFMQETYQCFLGLTYTQTLTKKFSYEFTPSFLIAYIQTKDQHILRDFYVTQYAQAYGYNLNLLFNYKLFKNSNFLLITTYKSFKDSNTPMNYFFGFSNEKFKSLPSSYNHKSFTSTLIYRYHF